ncbi:DNA polymerase IV [Dehalococcoides mccartyi]|jgi:DNA polymerase-4|uniref:DNA polymerase IV n=1 Tax=Dehalococcoides mccartyi TaxID=61435 RepID=A0A142V7R7_9CHLR|nr:DNA polymerase IV [Dehalococcoides mccartyi]AGG07123.1 DNA polymerase IV [Dehalococcoides mccartyi BTF08]AII60251.1 DNA polymerase IV [Dehalococcoides mccartyi CG5]AMU85842.1 DNA polymerase IV [Dehalococcoides mccartyi]AOV98694.1 DNA polymerase IV [Dehalococcoides mccartyi]AQW61724.1 DNA polymerase IV [Dehalococcoides mccartyi]
MSIRRVMHVDLDAFFVSVEQAVRPELKDKPVIVGGKPERRGVVAAASYEARKFGIHSGMPLITAKNLCPQAIFIEGNHQLYREYSEKFMLILSDFSPFLEPMGLDEAYLEVTGFESLHGSIAEMASKIRRRITAELGINASIGIANSKVAAKIATERAKPNGQCEVPAGEEASFLAPLDIAVMPGIGKKTEQHLKSLGIDTLGKLAALPASFLKSRLGAYAPYLSNAAMGIDNRPVEMPSEAKSISRETTFETDTRNQTFLEAKLSYLSEKITATLRKRGKQARVVQIKIRFADFTTLTRQKHLGQPASGNREIFQTALSLMNGILDSDRQTVRLLGVGISDFCGPEKQLEIDPAKARLEKLDASLDKIRQKYGFSSVQTGRTYRLKDMF